MMSLISCTASYETKGDRAYYKAQKAFGDDQRRLSKEAYIYYQKALKTYPNRVSVRLRNRFVEMTLVRAEMVLREGSAEMDAIPLFMQDMDDAINADVDTKLKERYAAFLSALADSSFAKRSLYKAMKTLDKAIGVAPNKTIYQNKKDSLITNFARANFEEAQLEFANGKTNNDPEACVKAEFMVQVALLYNKNYPGAQELLSDIRKQNKGTYSAYAAVITDKPDTAVYHQVNKYNILLAAPKVSEGPGSASLTVHLFNYSCNPQRLRPTNFFIIDEKGNKFVALPSSKIDREIVDQQIESKNNLNFKRSSYPIKKVCFLSDDGTEYTEKVFF